MDTAHVENHNEIGRKLEPARYVLRHIFFALDEMSLEFTGGATMEFIWLEPGVFTIGWPPSDDELLSLPMGEHLSQEEVEEVVTLIKEFLKT